MRPQLPRGQAPAKGILRTEQRTPVRFVTSPDGSTQSPVGGDPRGYWAPHSASASTQKRRRLVKAYGGIRQLKRARRAEREFTDVRVLS